MEFVQRANYREITDLLRTGKLEFAWICGFPYVRNRMRVTLLAVPVYKGKTTYRSYLIVSGYRPVRPLPWPTCAARCSPSPTATPTPAIWCRCYELAGLHQTSPSFFAKSFFTWSHRNVVQAVADGLAEGGAVDSYVWDILAQQHPRLDRANTHRPGFNRIRFPALRRSQDRCGG